MPLAADLPAQTQPVPRPAQVLYVSLELSPSKWLVTSLLSGTGRMSKHLVIGGDGNALLRLLAALRTRAEQRAGAPVVIVALLEVSQGGLPPTPGPKSIFFAVDDVEAVHARAERLDVLAPYDVHGEPAGTVTTRPWGERSFYIVDPWGNDLSFCENGTLYT